MSLSIYDSFDESEAFALVRRMELLPQLTTARGVDP